MLSRVPSPVVDSADGYERKERGARYPTGLQLIFAENAAIFTLVVGRAVVVAVM
jgi:hypothetical protein